MREAAYFLREMRRRNGSSQLDSEEEFAYYISAFLSAAAKHIAGDSKWLLFLVDILVSFGVVALLFAAMFKYLPEVKVSWRDVWRGALLSSAMFTVGKYMLALYFKYAAPTSAFGAAGSLAAVMLWVYYSSFILFFGAEFTKVESSRSAPIATVGSVSSQN